MFQSYLLNLSKLYYMPVYHCYKRFIFVIDGSTFESLSLNGPEAPQFDFQVLKLFTFLFQVQNGLFLPKQCWGSNFHLFLPWESWQRHPFVSNLVRVTYSFNPFQQGLRTCSCGPLWSLQLLSGWVLLVLALIQVCGFLCWQSQASRLAF